MFTVKTRYNVRIGYFQIGRKDFRIQRKSSLNNNLYLNLGSLSKVVLREEQARTVSKIYRICLCNFNILLGLNLIPRFLTQDQNPPKNSFFNNAIE